MGTIKVPTAEDNRRKVKALPWIGECPPDAQEDIKDFGFGVFCVHPEVFCTQSPRISQSTKNGRGKICLTFGLLVGRIFGLRIGLVCGLIIGLNRGGSAAIKHS